MRAESGQGESARELRLEGFGLIVAGVVLLAALAGSFVLGRSYERGLHPDRAATGNASEPGGTEGVAAEPASAEVDSGNYFDSMEGKEAEPRREARKSSGPIDDATRQAAATPAATSPPASDGGRFWVQVFAGRDERTAADLVRKLERAGNHVKLHTEREGSGSLYKVRVGAWSTREAASEAAETLRSQGYTGAWVTTQSPS